MSLPTCLPNASVTITQVHVARLRFLDREKYLEVITVAQNWQYTMQFVGGYTWEKLPNLTDAIYQLSPDDTSQGELYTHSLEGSIAFAKTSNTWANQLRAEDLLILITTSDNEQYLIGTLDQPAKMLGAPSVSGVSSIRLSFQSSGRHPLYSYAPVVSL